MLGILFSVERDSASRVLLQFSSFVYFSAYVLPVIIDIADTDSAIVYLRFLIKNYYMCGYVAFVTTHACLEVSEEVRGQC